LVEKSKEKNVIGFEVGLQNKEESEWFGAKMEG
jgi:hypothetical protein